MEDNKPRRNVPTFSRRSGDENDEIKREIKAAGRERTRRVSSLYGTGYEENPKLDYYNVFYLRGTINMMADDQGREW